jgi:hypothetical protein
MSAKAVGKAVLTLALAVAASGGAPAAEEKPYTYSGLISEEAFAKLGRAAEAKVKRKSGTSTFAVGAVTDAATWKAFTKAFTRVLGVGKVPAIDFEKYAVVFVILKENTNALDYRDWAVAADGTGTLTFEWVGIQPRYIGSYPAVLRQVERKGLKKLAARYNGTPLIKIDLPAGRKN